MKKLLLVVMVLMLVVTFGCKKVNAAIVDPSLGWSPVFTYPMDIGIVGFWFPTAKDEEPKTGVGTSVTAVRMTIPAVTFMTLDGNLLVAKEFDTTLDPLYGIGLMGNINLFKIKLSESVEVFPNLGIGLMNNFRNLETWNDLIDGFKTTIYGTLLLYKW
jgi:hypothetical protein